VRVHRDKVVRPNTEAELAAALTGREFGEVTRRAKYLLFELKSSERSTPPVTLVGHLGMTGRMFLQPALAPLPKHAAVSLDLGASRFVFEDTRYFGRFNLEVGRLAELGPEPLTEDFSAGVFAAALSRSSQPIKVKLLDQTVVSGVGNIYASEALFRAGISPLQPARRLKSPQIIRLRETIREVLAEAIECGSTIPLDFSGGKDRLFYYGSATEGESRFYQERLRVYDRAGEPCVHCATPIRHCVQAARSTYFCPCCQPANRVR
jgi:formamidopyrimidine-DNA glycosylase